MIHKWIQIKVLDWQSLIVLTNNHNEEVRVSILRLMHAYLERAPNSLKHSLIKNRGFLLLANQLYQFKTTSRLIEARDPRTARDGNWENDRTSLIGFGPWIPDWSCINSCFWSSRTFDGFFKCWCFNKRYWLDSFTSGGALVISYRKFTTGWSTLWWSLLEYQRYRVQTHVRASFFQTQLTGLNRSKELFESHSEIGDTMLDRGLSIVLTNSIARQTEVSKPVSQGLLRRVSF